MICNADSPTVRFRLLVCGIVQGVGFRPYVHQLATRYGLCGFVLNGPDGVVVEVEGGRGDIDRFLLALSAEAPPLARISAVTTAEIGTQEDTQFLIRESTETNFSFTLIPADICICENCLAETHDPNNRRYNYPFTNCTHCGPRYSIIRDIPYDRRNTTMDDFTMCDACQKEYENTSDRRFHAQPNACLACGPKLQLVTGGNETSKLITEGDVLDTAAGILLSGKIIALKGLGGYQLCCDARNQAAVEELRRRKHRPDKPFAIMVNDIHTADRLCFISKEERALLLSRERPIVLLQRRPEAPLAQAVFQENPSAGVMLPYTPLHDQLFRALNMSDQQAAALVMTSGNRSEEPIVTDNSKVEAELSSIADAFVHHNRIIHTRVDDSVIQSVGDQQMMLRRARGYAPHPVWLGRGDAELLACGAQQKSTFCLTRDGFALLSQHLGDLENLETLQFYEETLERMQKLFHIKPRIVVHDLHPGYLSTQFAMKFPAEQRIGIQHHHAHIASCMAEHGVNDTVIGIAWDGTGYGTDGTIWGGEFLISSFTGFERYAQLRAISMVGGDMAVREPWRIARSYLWDTFDGDDANDLKCWSTIPQEKLSIVDAMLERRIQTIETSSCGRLFDAVASLIGLRQVVSFEGQAAMALEAIASHMTEERYDFTITAQSPAQIDFRPMIRQIVSDLRLGTPIGRIAGRFHNTLVAAALAVCHDIRNRLGLGRICLSGGCFQNARLLRQMVETLRTNGFEVFHHRDIPANDGGISFGQAAIACELIRRRS